MRQRYKKVRAGTNGNGVFKFDYAEPPPILSKEILEESKKQFI